MDTSSTSEQFDHIPSVADTLGLGNRQRGDGCPGALKMHEANDGFIGRIRIAGGRASSDQLTALAEIAEALGDGNIHITTRGNVQVRGVRDRSGFAAAVCARGLLPSEKHDKVRNIIASPLSADLDPLVARLDAQLLESDEVTGLSGRTLFGLDSGAGDIAALRPDFGAQLCEGGVARVILGGVPTACGVAPEEVPATLVVLAEHWQNVRGDYWRVQESPELRESLVRVLAELDASRPMADPLAAADESAQSHKAQDESAQDEGVRLEDRQPVGWLERPDGLVDLGGALPFGVLSARVARLLAATNKPVRITPWAGVVIRDLDEHEAEAVARVLAPQGVVFDRQSPWLRVSACTGRPGCGKALSDVRADALTAIRTEALPAADTARAVHFSGCPRRCGHPLHTYWDYLAEGEGAYDLTVLDGTPATAQTY